MGRRTVRSTADSAVVVGAAVASAVIVGAWAAVASAQSDRQVLEAFDAGLSSAPQGLAMRECAACPEMVFVPAGAFIMGSDIGEEGRDPEEGPTRRVEVPAFFMARAEVTVGEFRSFVAATGRDMSGGCNYLDDDWVLDQTLAWDSVSYDQTDAHPVGCVSVEDAEAYAAWISAQPGVEGTYRLPTEAEFEYATRAGSTAPFHWGDDPAIGCLFANVGDASSVAALGWDPEVNFPCDDGFVYPGPVASLKPNAFGLFDMIGNVSEVVADCWIDNFRLAPGTAEARRSGPSADCASAPVRGGAWASLASYARSAARVSTPRDFRTDLDGFRLARDLIVE